MSQYDAIRGIIRDRKSTLRLTRHEHVGGDADRISGRRPCIALLGHSLRQAVQAVRQRLQKLFLGSNAPVVNDLGDDESKPGKGRS